MCWVATTHPPSAASCTRKYATWAGDSLFVLPNEQWGPRKRALQPVFTRQNVRGFGGHMSRAAQTFVDRWRDGRRWTSTSECRRVTMRSLGRRCWASTSTSAPTPSPECMHVASCYTADRALRPVRAPRWLPTPARRRARAAVATMRQVANEMVQACRADPTRDAPLVQALIAATGPGDRAGDLRRGHLQRPADLHAGRPRHDRDGAHLRAVGARAPPRRAGPGRRGGRRDRRSRTDARGRVAASDTPCRCCTRRCGCARPPQGSAEWRCVTSRWTATGWRRAAWCGGNLCAAPRSGIVARPEVFDPDRFSPESLERPRPLAVPAVPRRRTVLHRRTLRDEDFSPRFTMRLKG